jgi:hypothetical protein
MAFEIASGITSIMTVETTAMKFNKHDILTKITITTNLLDHTSGHVHISNYACIYTMISNPTPNAFMRDV